MENKTESKKLIVGVLMGGSSIECEVSFNSGRTICDHLDGNYIVKPIFQTKDKKLYFLPWHFLCRGKISDFENRLTKEIEPINLEELANQIDFMYLALHGRSGEDGTIQGLLELLGIPYLGAGVKGSILGMAKKYQNIILKNYGFKTPETETISAQDVKEENIKTSLDFPVIVKPAFEGSSLGVSLVHNKEELINAVKQAALISEHYQDVLVQEYIKGREFSCTIITNPDNGKLIALPVTEIKLNNKAYFCYDQKYMPGKAHKNTPADFSTEITDKIQESAIAIMQILDIKTVMRIDGFVTENNEVIFLDTNSLPGTGPTSLLFDQAAEVGYPHSRIINMLIEAELKWGKPISKKNNIYQHSDPLPGTIAVIMGGASNEKEISLESGRNVTYKLQQQGYNVAPIFLDKNLQLLPITEKLLVKNSTQEIAEALKNSLAISWPALKKYDFVFLALHGGAGENGIVQSALQALDIQFNGSENLASVLCMDKYLTKIVLQDNGLDVVPGVLLDKNSIKDTSKYSHLKWPLIVKPHDDGCSFFVSCVHTEEELLTAAETILAQKEYVLVEECVKGMELTIGVLGTDNPICLPASQVVRSGEILSIEEKFLPGAGENQTPAPLDEKTYKYIEEQILRAYNIIGCKNYARIDCFYQSTQETGSTKKLLFMEFNSLPALTPATCLFHQAAEIGLRPGEFLKKIVEDAKKNKELIFTTSSGTLNKIVESA